MQRLPKDNIEERFIISDPAVMAGRPVIAGTRITVDEILERLARGKTLEEIIEAHPKLTMEGVKAALHFAAKTVRTASPIQRESLLELMGPHRVVVEKEPAVAIRTFAPLAESISVHRPAPAARELKTDTEPSSQDAPPAPFPMQQIHPEGLFEAIFEGEADFFPYKLEITLPEGKTYVADDPYRFSPVISSDLHLMERAEASAGELYRLYATLGAHLVEHEGIEGASFALWAPDARCVSVIGDFNGWDARRNPMRPCKGSGFWELFIPGLGAGALYKYEIVSRSGAVRAKSDPFGFASELRPNCASIIWDLKGYPWEDAEWMAKRSKRQRHEAPIAIYEVHPGSWRQKDFGESPHERWLGYRELAEKLVPYAAEMGYTHIELLPPTEHPLDGSWGYQVTGYFAPTSRFGTPDDFRYFIDCAHKAGLGVIMDWVPSHFPKDEHALALFDGTPLFEHPDPRRSHQPDWGTFSFNLERREVRAFLLSNALFWLAEYHIDGLRLDAVSSMLYLDYSRGPGQWLPNEAGGRENLEAMDFFRRFNEIVHKEFPGVLTFAEEATAWPDVTGPAERGGLGFDFKWNMGWMHDTLDYFRQDPIFRRHHHNKLTFSLTYAFSERFTLPFSHDEVVHGKGALLSKMPGDYGQRFSNLRALYGWMYGHPGKKLLFMGGEIGQWNEWNYEKELDWMLLDYDSHRRLQEFVKELNRIYRREPALYEMEFSWEGFQWIECNDADRSILSFIRRSGNPNDFLVVASNFTPVVRKSYYLGVPAPGPYREILNSDAFAFGGSNAVNKGMLLARPRSYQGQPFFLELTLPPLSVIFLKPAK